MSPNLILAVVWGILAIIFGVSSNALHFPSNALSLDKSENKITIELIDVKCDKNENGMQVNVVFSQPFDGIIYSQGYFNDPKCRYVSAGENEKSHNFVVPFEGCGSKPSCSICDSIDNILIIQQDEEVQGEFDVARKISCSRSGIEDEKKIFFKPFIVEMLDVVTVPTSHGGVDCWMDIQRGIYPQLTAIGDSIKIGEALSVLVYLRDPNKEYDLTVRNCWAYDNEDFDDKKTGKVRLSDASGCSMKRKLLGSWKKTTQTGSSGATLLLHNTLRAFKFPDESQVYLKCDIEICRGTCAEAICDANEVHKVDCTVDPFNSNCINGRFDDDSVESTTLPLGFTTLPYRPRDTTKVSDKFTVQTTKRPIFNTSPTERFDYVSTTTFSDRETTTQTPFVCGPGSRDIRCRRPQNYETTPAPLETTTFRETTTLHETTTYPNSIQSNTIEPVIDSFCDRYPNSKRCSQRITEDLGPNVEILTFRPPSPFATVKYQTTTYVPTTNLPTTTYYSPNLLPDCARNPNDYRCRQNEVIHSTAASQVDEELHLKPINCQGNNLDPRCPNPTPTNTPPTYLPPVPTRKISSPRIEASTSPTIATTKKQTVTRQPTTRQPITRQPTTRQPVTKQSITKKPTNKFFICVPGSNDVNCDYEAKKGDQEPKTKEPSPEVKIPVTPPRNQFTTEKPNQKSICFVGSTNPECQKVSTKTITSQPKLSTAKPPTPFTPRSSTAHTSTCYPGSLDPKCTKATTKKPIFKPLSTTTNRYVASEIPVFVVQEQPICYPGSPDPACATGPSTKKPVPKVTSPRSTARPATFTTQKTIYKLPSTTRTPICSPGSSDKRCLELITTKRVYPTIGTTQGSISEIPSTTVFERISTTLKPQCYFGTKDPKCATIQATTTTETEPEITTTSTSIPETTTYKAINTVTKVPSLRCYPGSPDPQCKPNTKKPTFTPYKTDSQVTTKSPASTSRVTPTTKQTSTENLSTTTAPRCYIGSPDPRCLQTTKRPLTAIPEVSPKFSVTTNLKPTRPPVCYPGALDPRCRQSSSTTTTTAQPTSFGSRQEFSKIQSSTTLKPLPSISSTAPQCYPGSLDARCRQKTTITTTQRAHSVLVDQKQETNEVETSTPPKPAPPQCYPGSFDVRCRQSKTTPTTTQQTPKASFSLKQEFTKGPISTTLKPVLSSKPPQCYPGSLDPRCRQSTTTTTTQRTPTIFVDLRQDTNEVETSSTPKSVPSKSSVPPQCYPGSLDPRCGQSLTTTTAKPTSAFSLRQELSKTPTSTTLKPIPSKISAAPQCYLGSLDPRCRLPSTTTQRTPSTNLISKIATTTSKPILSPTCYPGSLDPRCKSTGQLKCGPGIPLDPRCPNPTPTAEPATYLPPFTGQSYKTTKPSITTKTPIATSTSAKQITCASNSLDPRCKTSPTTRPTPSTYTEGTTSTYVQKTTTKLPKSPSIPVISTTSRPLIRSTTSTTIKTPTYTTSAFSTTTKRPFTTSTTRRLPISSPQPFVTRPPPARTTTENILCYPGSPIEGCKTDVVTPSFCYPGSTDKRCPQLPPSFSTREPATYLPPFPDTKINRVKRSPIRSQETNEIVKFSLSFKPFSFS